MTMKKLSILAIIIVAFVFAAPAGRAQNIFAISNATVGYNLPGSSGIPFDSIHTTWLPHWSCSGATYSDIFVAKNCGFPLPANAHINGIMITIDVIIHYLDDSSVMLLKSGLPYGTDGALHRHISAAADITWGDTSALWGGSWTAADINDTGFGLQFRVTGYRSDSAFRWFDANPPLITITYDTVTALTVLPKNNVLSDVHIYPNPSGDIVHIDMAHAHADATIKLINPLGQPVRELNNITGNKCMLDLTGLPSGIYFIQITSPDGVFRSSVVHQ